MQHSLLSRWMSSLCLVGLVASSLDLIAKANAADNQGAALVQHCPELAGISKGSIAPQWISMALGESDTISASHGSGFGTAPK